MAAATSSTDRLPRERLAELVSAAAYGSVLTLAALSVIGVSDLGRGTEIVAGVGVATWLAHLFAELLGGHVRHIEPLHRSEISRAAIDGSPILASTIVPAMVLGLGRLDVVPDDAARLAAIVLGVLQLMAIGAFVARVSPTGSRLGWAFAALTAGVGVLVVLATVLFGH